MNCTFGHLNPTRSEPVYRVDERTGTSGSNGLLERVACLSVLGSDSREHKRRVGRSAARDSGAYDGAPVVRRSSTGEFFVQSDAFAELHVDGGDLLCNT